MSVGMIREMRLMTSSLFPSFLPVRESIFGSLTESVKKTCILSEFFMVFFCKFFRYNYSVEVICHVDFC